MQVPFFKAFKYGALVEQEPTPTKKPVDTSMDVTSAYAPEQGISKSSSRGTFRVIRIQRDNGG